MRDGAESGTRPKLGRKPKSVPNPPTEARPHPSSSDPLLNVNNQTKPAVEDVATVESQQNTGAKIQNTRPARSTRNPNPNYVNALAA